jgi:hypothetical protein
MSSFPEAGASHFGGDLDVTVLCKGVSVQRLKHSIKYSPGAGLTARKFYAYCYSVLQTMYYINFIVMCHIHLPIHYYAFYSFYY